MFVLICLQSHTHTVTPTSVIPHPVVPVCHVLCHVSPCACVLCPVSCCDCVLCGGFAPDVCLPWFVKRFVTAWNESGDCLLWSFVHSLWPFQSCSYGPFQMQTCLLYLNVHTKCLTNSYTVYIMHAYIYTAYCKSRYKVVCLSPTLSPSWRGSMGPWVHGDAP